MAGHPPYFFGSTILSFYLLHQFLSGKMDSAFYCAKVQAKFICNLLVFVAAVVHLERYPEFRLQVVYH